MCSYLATEWIPKGSSIDSRRSQKRLLFSKTSKLSAGNELLVQGELEDLTVAGKVFRACRV